jgi:hypothetical protein
MASNDICYRYPGVTVFYTLHSCKYADDQGLIELLSNHLDYFRAKPVNIPKITILLDHGYHPNKIAKALHQVYPQLSDEDSLEVAPIRPLRWQMGSTGKNGVVVVATSVAA